MQIVIGKLTVWNTNPTLLMGYSTEIKQHLSLISGKGKRKSFEIKKKKSKKNTRTLNTIIVSRANGVSRKGSVFTRIWKLARISKSTAAIPR